MSFKHSRIKHTSIKQVNEYLLKFTLYLILTEEGIKYGS